MLDNWNRVERGGEWAIKGEINNPAVEQVVAEICVYRDGVQGASCHW